MNSVEKNKFLGMLYDVLISDGIIKYEDKPRDLKEKKERLEKYLDKLERVQDKSLDNDRYLDIIKKLYYDRYIIKESDIPDNYLRNLEQQYLDQGHGHINLVNPQNDVDKRLRNEHIKTVIREQKDSLDNWLNYFLSSDSSYLEMWAKVWAFHGMLRIGNLNVGKDGYERRSKTNVNPFVSFDAEILGKCVDLVKETFEKKELTDEEVKKLVSSGSFPKLYGMLLANKKQIKAETTEGIWIKYNKETNQSIEEKLKSGQEPEYIRLYNSLQGYNTGWCTAGARETAKEQILGGDFYVYYSKDKEGEYKIPRLAIRMEDFSIGEIRGIASGQNIESNMEEILEEKLKEFPDRDRYKKKVNDMKTLTTIYNKHLNDEELTEEELIFVYQIYDMIEGFGYEKDPRIEEILAKRNKRKDLTYVLDCTENEIGLTNEEFNSERKLKYYEGDLIFRNLKSVEGLVLPNIMNGNLILIGLTSAEDLALPNIMNGDLLLIGLTSAEGLVLPQIINGNLHLRYLKSADGLLFPNTVNGSLYLSNMVSAKDLVLPTTINGDLDLGNLIHAEGLVLPTTINCDLDLRSIINVRNLELPEEVGGKIYVYGDEYTLDEVKEMKRQEEEQLKNNNHKGLKRVKQDGFISNTIIILNIILFGILCFILTLLIIK